MRFKFRFALGLWLAAVAAAGWAQDYPTKPIRFVVAYAPGGSADIIARLLADRVSAQLGQPVIVDNRPGAVEQIAASVVAKSPPDGYTVLVATQFGLAVNPLLYHKMQYDPAKDFTSVAALARIPSIVATNPQVPAKTLEDLTAYMKANPGKASYGGAGPPLMMELYKRSSGVDAIYVQYKGGAPALQDLMAGNIQIMIGQVSEVMPLAKSGKVRALAVTASQRLPRYPDLPTTAEAPGMKEFVSYTWYSMVAPAGTPQAVIEKLNAVVNRALADAAVRERLAGMDIEQLGGTPARLSSILSSEGTKWKTIIDAAGIKVE